MTAQILRIVVNILITALVFVVAMGVWFMFRRVINPPDAAVVAINQAEREAATSVVPFPGAPQQGPAQPEVVGNGAATTTATPPECAEPAPAGGVGMVLTVYYTCGQSAAPMADRFVYREVPPSDLVLTRTMEELVKGPDVFERAAGFVSFFSEETVDAFAGVTLNAGRATIEFRGLESIDNISTASGSEFFLANLNANVFQFDTIDAVEYRLNGTCDDFWNLLQRDCQLVTKAEWERQLAAYRDQG
ncbi:MAG TPA: GerMN domain-containing protein [Acidimicrobiia bacterium]|nr:GerMN domain-containing protein [Acidimicrobiia bacterium]